MKMKHAEHKSWMNAVAFAEAGEWETARDMIPDERQETRISWFSRIFMAAAFAESGLSDEARRCLDDSPVAGHLYDDFMRNVGLAGIRMTYGVLAVEVNR